MKNRYRTKVDPEVVRSCREALLEAGVDVTPEGLNEIVKLTVEIAGHLSSKKVTLQLSEAVDLTLDVEKGMLHLTTYDEADA